MGYRGYFMKPGDQLGPDDYLVPQNGAFWLGFNQVDGLTVFVCNYLNGNQIWNSEQVIPDSSQITLTFDAWGDLKLNVDGQTVWGSGQTGGKIFILGNDGNFGVYSGSDPSDPGNLLWQAGCSQGNGEIQSMTNVNYDLTQATTTPAGGLTLDTLIFKNSSENTATAIGNLTGTYSQTSSWSVGGSVSVSVETEVEAGIPLVADGKVTIGVTASFNWQYGQQYTQTQSVSQGINEEVPPKTCLEFLYTAEQVQVTLPFSATMTIYFPQSGVTVSGAGASGLYAGGQGTDFTVVSKGVKCHEAWAQGWVSGHEQAQPV